LYPASPIHSFPTKIWEQPVNDLPSDSMACQSFALRSWMTLDTCRVYRRLLAFIASPHLLQNIQIVTTTIGTRRRDRNDFSKTKLRSLLMIDHYGREIDQ
jgi:hypothetical protein